MTIRPAAREDLAAIAKIQAASREASAWEPSSYLDYLCHVAVIEGRVAGFLVFRRIAQDVPEREHEILNLCVDPMERRRGVGRALVASALAEMSGAWYLEVRESNIAAIRLYESLGFEAAGRREDYYADPREAAIVMRFFS